MNEKSDLNKSPEKKSFNSCRIEGLTYLFLGTMRQELVLFKIASK